MKKSTKLLAGIVTLASAMTLAACQSTNDNTSVITMKGDTISVSDFYNETKNTEISQEHKLRYDCWPPTEEEKIASDKAFLQRSPIALIADPTSWELFTQEELRKLIPIAEQKWIDWKGKLPDDYVSPLK
ncbi:hypothetical protein KP779_01740 [Streptococcus equi subsp. equi]|uniref:hypothetical protein n=1 Tax=Streptococcus equi TaxID=1336 RepID=UPI001E424916|nr:hypothetical protein [Streptococcus equi]MCD3456576.1 hypothetical protein [Streptococcus equi subsp. equi]